MFNQAFIAALLAVTVAGAPVSPQARQLTGTDSGSGLGGLLGGLGGSTGTPTGGSIPELPTGLLGGLGGGSGTPTGGAAAGLPTGLLGGLGGSGSSGDLGELLGGSTGSETGSSGLSAILGHLGSGSSTATVSKRQSSLGGLLGGTGTSSSSSSLTSLLSGLGLGGTGTTTGSSSAAASTTDSTSILGSGSALLGSGSSSSSSGFGSLLGGSSTQNGLSDACKSVTLIFARGTTETGNMGTVVGPGLATDVQSALNNNVAIQGVDYAADAAGISSESLGPGTGSQAMIADVKSALSKCPSTQIVLSGYSQGAMLVHNTMGALSSTQAASVKACVTFGDPFVGTAIKNIASANWKSFCASGDPVCESGAAMSPATGGTASQSTSSHLGYGADVQTAANFIKGKVTV